MSIHWKHAIDHFCHWKKTLAELDTSGQQVFVPQRRPVSPDKVTEAERLVGTVFPQDYKDFLRHFDGFRGFSNLLDLYGATDVLQGKSDALRKLPRVMEYLAHHRLRDEDVVPIGADPDQTTIMMLFSPTSRIQPSGVFVIEPDDWPTAARSFAVFFIMLTEGMERAVVEGVGKMRLENWHAANDE